MAIKAYKIYQKPIARFLAKTFGRCTIILSTGKKVKLKKGHYTYESPLTIREEEELNMAISLLSF